MEIFASYKGTDVCFDRARRARRFSCLEARWPSAEVMTQLVTMAAPYQDLQSVRLRPKDGCYW